MKRLAMMLVLAACGAAPRAGDTLVDSIRAYNDGVRWGRFEVAAIHIPAKERSQFVDDNDERAKDLKITQYDVVNVDQKGDREAKVHIKMEWYSDREGTVHETHAVQTWERRGKDWIMVDEARLKGTEMPGLPEPLMSDGANPAPDKTLRD
ncbi:MAG TPA: hypothetical protein VFQ65_34505 [Kofleriaceae bacterium]|nr:hypothetical protein [Kofleriaceae bacterium]